LALRRFASWQATSPDDVPPRVALEGVGLLWDLLPPRSRERPVETAGVQRMHSILARLGTRR